MKKPMFFALLILLLSIAPISSDAAGWAIWLKAIAQMAIKEAAQTTGDKVIDAFIKLFNKGPEMDTKQPIRGEKLKLVPGKANANRRLWDLQGKQELTPQELKDLALTLKKLDKNREQALAVKSDGAEQLFVTTNSGNVFHGNSGSITQISGLHSSAPQSPVIGTVTGNVNINYNPAPEAMLAILKEGPKKDSDLRIVAVDVRKSDDSLGNPMLDIKMRNVGSTVAFLKSFHLKVIGSETYEDCRKPAYKLELVTAEYELDVTQSRSISISQVIAPNDVDRFLVKLGRAEGGPTPTIYKAKAEITYDENNKVVSSDEFFVSLVGPTIPLAFTTFPISKEDWNACVERNRKKFCTLGYKLYRDDPEDVCKRY